MSLEKEILPFDASFQSLTNLRGFNLKISVFNRRSMQNLGARPDLLINACMRRWQP